MGRLRDLFSPTQILGQEWMSGFRTLPDGTEEPAGGGMEIVYDRKKHEVVYRVGVTGTPEKVEKLCIPFGIRIWGRRRIKRYIEEKRPQWPTRIIRP